MGSLCRVYPFEPTKQSGSGLPPRRKSRETAHSRRGKSVVSHPCNEKMLQGWGTRRRRDTRVAFREDFSKCLHHQGERP
jgi:hypothetical protein